MLSRVLLCCLVVACVGRTLAGTTRPDLSMMRVALDTSDDDTGDPSYDHQTTTYTTRFDPVYADNTVTVTPFFSPDHSIGTLTDLISSVSMGGTIEIGTPGFSSWSGCTPFTGCQGCSIINATKEQFPIFHALLNAVHVQKATVRILTNNYNTPTCPGLIAPLDFLVLNGIQVKYFDTVTFLHEKYITVDGNRTAVSSVNWSYTSFMENREAGVIITDGGGELIKMAMQVWESDWAQATDYVVTNTYTAAELAVIQNPAKQAIVIPKQKNIPEAYVTPTPFPAASETTVIYTSPDHARYELFRDLNTTQHSFELFMYQVTDFGLCQELQRLYTNTTIDLTIYVSKHIYAAGDSALAQECYGQLYKAGATIHLSPWYYTYSHAKFWIVDRGTSRQHVGMSTGNWSPTDYPPADVFPPYGQGNWVKANRDYTMRMWGEEVVAQFSSVFHNDLIRGTEWYPANTTAL